MASTILCADDDRTFCQILARAFRAQGFSVETAHDGETALEKLRDEKPDLVTLDVLLPRRDGFAVLEAIRRGGPDPDVPVLLFSGCTITPAYQQRAQRLRASAFLQKPVPLERLLALAAQLLEQRHAPSGAPHRAPAPPSPSPGSGARRLEGRFEELTFPEVLHHLHGLRASGVLEIQEGRKKKQIQLRDGRPVAVRSNLVNETLGHLLVASGKLTWDVVQDSVQRVKRGEGLQGQILVAMHMLDEADLALALRRQGEEKLFEAFSWPTGRFRFHRDARVKRANALALKRSAANVILEGVQRTPVDQVEAYLAARRSRVGIPGEKPFYRFQELDLDAPARELLARLDGSRRLAELGPLDEAAKRLLFGLLVLEMVELRDAPVRGAPRARRARAARPAPAAELDPAPRAPAPAAAASPDETRLDPEEAIRSELATMAERFRGRDWFGILGVAREADDEEIRHAYTDLAKRTHPDRFSGSGDAVVRLAEEVFGLVSRAYESIGTRDRRMHTLREEATRERDRVELEEGHRALRAELEFQKGEAALRGRRYDAAARHFRAAWEAYPEEGEYRTHYGWAHWLEDPEAPGRLKEALEHVLAGRKLAPDREKSYLFLGRLYKQAGRTKTAEKMFTRAVQLDPDCVEALRELRLIHMRREKSRGLVRRILRR